MNIDGDGNLSNDPWLRVTDFDRYGVDIRMEDGSIIHGVGVIISARDPSTGKVYQSMVFGDDLVATLNNTNMNLNRIVLTSYIPTGNDGGDLTQRFLTTNFANNVAEFAVVPCFARGTLIATDRGQVPVEDLARGDRVVTSDHGFQKVRWIGSQTVRAEGKMAPSFSPQAPSAMIANWRSRRSTGCWSAAPWPRHFMASQKSWCRQKA